MIKNREAVVYLVDSKMHEVFYLLKDCFGKAPHLHDKLVGWGGRMETVDSNSIIDCAIRELEEELGLSFKKEELSARGQIFRPDRTVAVFTSILDKRLEEKYIENEGIGIYKPKDYHLTNPKKFLESDIEMLNKLYSTDDYFEIKI